jgi:hypothetical protein
MDKKISPQLIDKHCKNCGDCEKRRLMMKELYSIEIPPVENHLDEIAARDLLLDQVFNECCKCFIKTFGL